MKFELKLSGDKLLEELQNIENDNVDYVVVTITGTVDDQGKAKVTKASVSGTCVSEYSRTIEVL